MKQKNNQQSDEEIEEKDKSQQLMEQMQNSARRFLDLKDPEAMYRLLHQSTSEFIKLACDGAKPADIRQIPTVVAEHQTLMDVYCKDVTAKRKLRDHPDFPRVVVEKTEALDPAIKEKREEIERKRLEIKALNKAKWKLAQKQVDKAKESKREANQVASEKRNGTTVVVGAREPRAPEFNPASMVDQFDMAPTVE